MAATETERAGRVADPKAWLMARFALTPASPRPWKLERVRRPELYGLFAELGYRVGCEVGVEKGKNAQEMHERIRGLRLYAVDPYRQHPQCSYAAHAYLRHWDVAYLARVEAQAHARLDPRGATFLREFSEDAARLVPDASLDFVYIDGDHSYDFVMLDIILWGRKVRQGGIVAGHDYYLESDRPGRRAKVTRAVDDYCRVHGIDLMVTAEAHPREKGDSYPSWLWVKEGEVWPNVVGA